MPARKVGEVLEASTIEFMAAADELHAPPEFGSLVVASNGREDVLGLVYEATTASADSGRPAVVRGRGLPDEASIYQANPQLEKLLRTDFRAVVVGFRDGSSVRQYLPSWPVKVHTFVREADADTLSAFFQNVDYLSLLVGTKANIPTDELIAASLRQGMKSGLGEALLVKAGKELVLLFGGSALRLNTVLRRLGR